MRGARAAFAASVLLTSAGPVARAESWPNWRGPNLNGSSSETGLPERWSEAENTKWVASLPGPSSATPVIWGDRVFLSSMDSATRKLLAMSLSARDGSVLWRVELGRNKRTPRNNSASPSPVTDGNRVWYLYGTGDLACLDFGGNVVWRRNLVEDYGSFAVKFGYSSSPLLWRGKLFVPVLQRERSYPYSPERKDPPKHPFEAYILAVDPATGKDIWRHVRPTDARDESREAYITPMPVEHGGRAELLINAGEYVTGHDPEDGRELWRWEFAPGERRKWHRIISSLTTAGPDTADGSDTDAGLIFAVRARGGTMYALRSGARGRASDETVAWKIDGPYPDVCTPLLYRGGLYVLGGDKRTLTLLDPRTGEVKGRRKFDSPPRGGSRPVFRASPTGADGRIYCMNEGGDVWVLSASPGLDVLFQTSLGEEPCRSTIAVSGGRLFIRTPTKLYCIGR